MRHKAAVPVDSESLCWWRTPARRSDQHEEEYVRATFREELSFLRWCQSRGLDPLDTESMVVYEGDVGWLYIGEQEDHRV